MTYKDNCSLIKSVKFRKDEIKEYRNAKTNIFRLHKELKYRYQNYDNPIYIKNFVNRGPKKRLNICIYRNTKSFHRID